MFASDKFPYLLSILFALLGWSCLHVTDRMLSKPILEYSVDSARNGNSSQYEYLFENLSPDKIYDSVRLSFILSNPSRGDFITFFEIYSVTGYIFSPNRKIQFRENAECVLIKYQPGFKVKVVCKVEGNTFPIIRYYASTPLFIIKKGFETFIVKNETTIFFTLITIWVILITIYLFTVKFET